MKWFLLLLLIILPGCRAEHPLKAANNQGASAQLILDDGFWRITKIHVVNVGSYWVAQSYRGNSIPILLDKR